MVARYEFHTTWALTAPIDEVYGALHDFRRWPEWWPGVIVAEEVGSDRLRQSGIVEQDREVLTGLLAAALPGCSNFRAVRITDMHAIGRCVLGLALFQRNEGQ